MSHTHTHTHTQVVYACVAVVMTTTAVCLLALFCCLLVDHELQRTNTLPTQLSPRDTAQVDVLEHLIYGNA
jgi:hypothetical protein